MVYVRYDIDASILISYTHLVIRRVASRMPFYPACSYQLNTINPPSPLREVLPSFDDATEVELVRSDSPKDVGENYAVVTVDS